MGEHFLPDQKSKVFKWNIYDGKVGLHYVNLTMDAWKLVSYLTFLYCL